MLSLQRVLFNVTALGRARRHPVTACDDTSHVEQCGESRRHGDHPPGIRGSSRRECGALRRVRVPSEGEVFSALDLGSRMTLRPVNTPVIGTPPPGPRRRAAGSGSDPSCLLLRCCNRLATHVRLPQGSGVRGVKIKILLFCRLGRTATCRPSIRSQARGGLQNVLKTRFCRISPCRTQ